jgi:Asp/Glu/hydantoin racemase
MARIVWQSFLDPERHASYFLRLRERLAELADPAVEFTVVGMTPPDRLFHRLTETRCGLRSVHNAIQAERDGYQAYVIGHFQEPNLEDARSLLDIPVVGFGESSLLFAATLGYKIGLITIDPVFIRWHENQVERLGLERRVVGVTSMQITADEFMTAMTPGEGRDEVLRQFEEQAAPLLDAGAEVLVPAGALTAITLCATIRNFSIGGARVLDGVAVSAVQAQAAVRLHRLTGVEPSRRSTYQKPSLEVIEEFLSETAGPPVRTIARPRRGTAGAE